ncbi:MAG: hypothetical protein HY209_03100 [Candidatus Omnitrophica bacterium]|nr:hypothetical protein [Candidatus Omnitrophota bacterium]
MLKKWNVKRLAVMLTTLVLGFSFMVPSVYAKGQGKGGSHSPGPGFEPKGWDEGKKKGWNGGEEPPGLAKQDKDKDKNKNKDKHKKNKKHKGKKEEKKENKEAEKHEAEKK